MCCLCVYGFYTFQRNEVYICGIPVSVVSIYFRYLRSVCVIYMSMCSVSI